MKLVDILARELKAWPEKSVAAVQQNSTDDRVSFVDCVDVEFSMGQWDYSEPCMRIHEQKESHEFERADDWKTAIVTRAEWQAAVDALNAPKVVEWPDLGETVEVIKGPAEWDDEQIRMIGREGKVRSVFKNDCDQKIVAIELSSGECKCLIVECIKPSRTAEQVAAEERKSQILDMIDSFGTDTAIWGRDAVMEICGHLWEYGYRKQ